MPIFELTGPYEKPLRFPKPRAGHARRSAKQIRALKRRLPHLRSYHYQLYDGEVARLAGIGRRTLLRWTKKDPPFAEKWQKAKRWQLYVLANEQMDSDFGRFYGSGPSLSRRDWLNIEKYIRISGTTPADALDL